MQHFQEIWSKNLDWKFEFNGLIGVPMDSLVMLERVYEETRLEVWE